jgi:CDP-glycerol glycerophosphotransferase
VLETGYPRNDVLVADDGGRLRERARAALGLATGERAILYAPTWRDDSSFTTELDPARLAERLGEGNVLLVRAHKAVAATVALEDHPQVRNVSDRDDASELLLAADVLVTDYSSVMFDFAATGRPMLFFTYDLAWYRDRLRGFYFDFEADAPGPLVESTDALADALSDVDAWRPAFVPAYARFRERFCHLDDGRAAERVVDAVFGAPPQLA